MRLVDDGVGCNKRPALGGGLLEKAARGIVVRILGHEMGEPGSAVDQNALHLSSAYTRGEVLVLVAGDVGEVGVAGRRKRQPALKSGAMRPVGAASLFVRQPFLERIDELLAFLRKAGLPA